jgi:Copper binding periplasmic protein CusF
MRQKANTATLNRPFHMVLNGLGLVLSFSCLWLSACGEPKSTASNPPKLYTLHGTVLSLNPKDHTATIQGDAIPGWMDAMTMDYPVKKTQDWLALRPKEIITATVEVRDMGYAIRDVKPAGTAEQPK